jgi:alpha-beta hydrolase superfamily lysophospholipase
MKIYKPLFLLIGIFLFYIVPARSQKLNFVPDTLKNGFEQLTIEQPDDYEGKVVTTLVRKLSPARPGHAVLYVHGKNDYFFQTEMAENYLKNGYDFYAIDLRKYGRSYRNHQIFNNMRNIKEYYADLDTALKIIRKAGYKSVLLSGHSTGGLIVACYAEDRAGKELFDALFLNSPFLDMNLSPVLKKIILPMLAHKGVKHPDAVFKTTPDSLYAKSLHKHFYGEWDFNDWKKFASASMNNGWLHAIHAGHLRVHDRLHIQKPILVMCSDASGYDTKWTENFHKTDEVLNVKDIQKYALYLGDKVTLNIIHGAVHDLMLSVKPVRKEVYSNLFGWLSKTIP